MTPDNAVDHVEAPADGFWRVGPATDPYQVRPPLTAEELNLPNVGNRFDSPLGTYGVVYFCTRLEGSFGETLARYRPDPAVAPIIQGDWSSQGFMMPGEVPADWRHRRLAVRARPPSDARFLDVESPATRATLAKRLAPVLAAYKVMDLDVSAIRSGDRRLTRQISYWAWSQTDEDETAVYAGIRYLSRLNSDWECWGLFDDVPTEELERRAITREMSELQAIAKLWDLKVF